MMNMSTLSKTLRRATGLALAILLVLVMAAPTAVAEVEDIAKVKAEWQGEYRGLLQEALRLRTNATNARRNYAEAQRRNYPRGGARQQYLIDADAAEKQLAKVEQDIEALRVRARHEGAMPAWFYEVDDEDIVVPRAPAAADPNGQDREGRNPLYLEDETE